MCSKKLSKFDGKYIKSHYITKFEIDNDNKKIKISYIDGETIFLPLTSGVLSSVRSTMRIQYDEWQNLVKRIYTLHPIKILHLNLVL